MRIIIGGSSGLIGTELVNSLRQDGHEVLRLVRRKPASTSEIFWDPTAGQLDYEQLAGCEVFINLAGAGVGDSRWTDKYKALILSSRVETTSLLAKAAAHIKPQVYVAGSAIGWYGDTSDQQVDETSPAGTGFLPDVVVAWEKAADPARVAGVRVVNIRTGLVAAKNGGAWSRLLPIFKMGAGGKLGSGNQYWSFISMRDQIAAIKFVISNSSINGPVNLTAPKPATNAEVTKAMSKVFSRPSLFPVPAFVLKSVLGEFSQEILGSARVIPKVLIDAGFVFQDPDIESAMRTLASK